MKILIIGSKGFIGSHCVSYFGNEHEVWECDVIFDFNSPRYLNIDAVDSDFAEIFRTHQFDLCINCSGAASVPFSMEKPLNDFKLNVQNIVYLLEAIRIYNPDCKFLTMSSAAVYGNPKSLPIAVNAEVSPVSPYGYHKAFAERVCEEYYRFWGIQTCCVRIFSAYGPGLKKQLLWDLHNKFAKEEKVILWGTGEESRDFIYIDDLISALNVVISHSSFAADVVNVANGKQISVREVAETYKRIIASTKLIQFVGAERKGDPINWEADISQLQQWDYCQSVSLEHGIKKYTQWLEEESL